ATAPYLACLSVTAVARIAFRLLTASLYGDEPAQGVVFISRPATVAAGAAVGGRRTQDLAAGITVSALAAAMRAQRLIRTFAVSSRRAVVTGGGVHALPRLGHAVCPR